MSPKPDESTRFLKALFGWTVTQQNAMGYREVDTGPEGLPGGVWPGPPEERPFVQLFVSVPDVAAAAEQAKALGATIVIPHTVLPDGDAMAILADPTGLPIAVCSLRSQHATNGETR